MNKQKLIEKQAQVSMELETFVKEANQRIAAFNGALEMLAVLIAEDNAGDEEE